VLQAQETFNRRVYNYSYHICLTNRVFPYLVFMFIIIIIIIIIFHDLNYRMKLLLIIFLLSINFVMLRFSKWGRDIVLSLLFRTCIYSILFSLIIRVKSIA
jgi:hypothetical protein